MFFCEAFYNRNKNTCVPVSDSVLTCPFCLRFGRRTLSDLKCCRVSLSSGSAIPVSWFIEGTWRQKSHFQMLILYKQVKETHDVSQLSKKKKKRNLIPITQSLYNLLFSSMITHIFFRTRPSLYKKCIPFYHDISLLPLIIYNMQGHAKAEILSKL